jgi:hypothetical protein
MHAISGNSATGCRLKLRIVVMALLLCAGLATAALVHSPRAHAAGAGPIIHWDSSMIYAGQNNGYPWGPVGEQASVHGAQFLDVAVLSKQINLALIAGDVNNPPGGDSSYEFCKLAGPKISIGSANVDASGNFDYQFTWPSAASSGAYSICAYNTVDGLPAGNVDDGPFTVLSGSAPSVAVSRSTVAAGESITVTGSHWVPPQPVNVYIAACADCDGPIVVHGTAHSSGLHSGTFSITFTIPAAAAPGAYVAGAIANSILDVGPAGARHVTITAAAPTATPQPTATVAQATQTSAAGSGTGNTGSSNDQGGTLFGFSPVVLVAGGISILLLLLALILVIILLARRGAKQTPPSGGAQSGWGGQGPQTGGYPAYGAAPMEPTPSGSGSVQQNWQTLAPGWNDQTPPTVNQYPPQGDETPTRTNMSQFADPALYPPAPPAAYPPPRGDTPTQPGSYNDGPPDPYRS